MEDIDKVTIEITEVIYEFHNELYDTTNGVYRVKVNGELQIFVRNDKSVGTICHYLGRSASQCVSIIRDDVKQDFLNKLSADARRVIHGS